MSRTVEVWRDHDGAEVLVIGEVTGRRTPPTWGYYGGDPGEAPEVLDLFVESEFGEPLPLDGLGEQWLRDAEEALVAEYERTDR